MNELTHQWNTDKKLPIIAFLLSILFTALSFFFAYRELPFAIPAIVIFAFCQGILQLTLFLHIGIEKKPRWNLMMLLFTLLILVVVVGGSMWIMYNLNYQMMQ